MNLLKMVKCLDFIKRKFNYILKDDNSCYVSKYEIDYFENEEDIIFALYSKELKHAYIFKNDKLLFKTKLYDAFFELLKTRSLELCTKQVI